jgi:hypothetical protein
MHIHAQKRKQAIKGWKNLLGDVVMSVQLQAASCCKKRLRVHHAVHKPRLGLAMHHHKAHLHSADAFCPVADRLHVPSAQSHQHVSQQALKCSRRSGWKRQRSPFRRVRVPCEGLLPWT